MIRHVSVLVFILLSVAILTTACGGTTEQGVYFASYRDIPGISDEQISAIADLRENRDYFIYGMLQNDDAFYSVYGEIIGFTAQMCRWLSDIFGIEFVPVIFDDLPDLMAALDDGTADFTGQLPYLGFLFDTLLQTDPISKRSVAIVRPVRGARPLEDILLERPLNLAFNRGAVVPEVLEWEGYFGGEFVVISVDSAEQAAEMLTNGTADAFIGDGVITLSIDFPGFRVEPLYPLMFGYSTFSAGNEELFPIVEVVQLALENGGMSILADLYAAGKQETAKHRFELLISDEERAFIAQNPVIPVAAHGFSYPISFFNNWEGEIQGVAHDILREIEVITGLEFELTAPEGIHLTPMMNQLQSGEALMAVGTFRRETMATDDTFLLSAGFFSDSYTLLSRACKPVIGVNEVIYMRVGLIGGGIYDEVFAEMFPEHLQTVRFAFQDNILDALEDGEIDLAFTSMRGLLRATHLLERPGFRANILLDKSFDISFAVNENAPLLQSIIDHALTIANIDAISADWVGRTFDFTVTMLRRQRPLLVGLVALLFVVLVMTVVISYISWRNTMRAMTEKQRLAVAEEANSAKTRFLARMSHEIRTPITAVLGISEIELQTPGLPSQFEYAFSKIHSSAKLLLGIVNDVLDISKIGAGKMEIHKEIYEVASVINDITRLHLNVKREGIDFKLSVDEKMPSHLFGDIVRIEQVVSNLLSNAFKYTNAGTVRLSWSCEENNDETIMLVAEVSDTGFGMTEEQLRILQNSEYERFHEYESSIANGGTGLGMPIVFSLLKLMDADINITSKVGAGTNVVVRIPQGKIRGTSESIGKERAARLQNLDDDIRMGEKRVNFEPMPYGSVCVVDDVDANLYVARGLLSFYGLKIECCRSGNEVIEKVKGGAIYDIIFMDYMMPDLNGVETMNILREMGYTAPIITLTANALIEQEEEFMKSGFDGFISKPIQTKQLGTALKKFIRDKQTQETLDTAASLYGTDIRDSQQDAAIHNEKLRHDFARSHKNMAAEIKSAAERSDMKTGRYLSHTLKGVSGLIHETALRKLAEQAEHCFAEEKLPPDSLISSLEEEFYRVLDGIEKRAQLAATFAAAPVRKDFSKTNALATLDDVISLLEKRDSECLDHIPALREIPDAAVLIRQLEEYEFAAAKPTARTLRAIIAEL